eukprot:14022763-Alexandrium_andersonii.AAC.1
MERACTAVHASSAAVRPWTSTPAAALAASTHAMTLPACAGLDAPGGQSSATWPMASAVQHRAAPTA